MNIFSTLVSTKKADVLKVHMLTLQEYTCFLLFYYKKGL